MPRTEHAELRKVAGKWRTVKSGPGTSIIKSPLGNPIDGGGWSDREKAVGERQVQHINEGVGKKYGRL